MKTRERQGQLETHPGLRGWLPLHGIIGLLLIGVAWPTSWLHLGLLGEFSFFPLWVGYILVVDALVHRRTGTSLLTGKPLVFCGMFLVSIPLWWVFEGINQFTQNWHYLGAERYSPLEYTLIASWHFSIVVPAVFETATLLGTFGWVKRWHQGPKLPVSRSVLLASVILGVLSLASLALWPRYSFFATWLCLLLILDPVNHWLGRPSLLAQVRQGDWRLVIAFSLGALVCGWFWEMWNFYAFPKWEYRIPFVEYVHVFEMPLLGYLGYLPFGLEVYAAYHFIAGVVGRGLFGVESRQCRSIQ